jgi:hypothetical protein
MKLKTLSVYLTEKNINQEAFDALDETVKATHYDALNTENANSIREEIKSGSEEIVKEMKLEMSEMYNEQFETLNKALRQAVEAQKTQGLALQGLMEKGNGGESSDMKKEFETVKDQIIKIGKGTQQGAIELKAITNVASVATNTAGYDIPDVGQLATAERNAYSIFPKLRISDNQNIRKTINYWDWDEATTVRSAAMVAEGGTFPESTATWKQYTMPIQKIGDTLTVSEEFMEDEQMFYAELGMFVRTNVEIIQNSQIITGDGTGNNLSGLVTVAPDYVPAASGISDASIYDLIVKLRESISTTGGAKYRVNFALMNISDINKMKLKKDANENYIMPPFVDRSGTVVDGLTIVEDNSVVANTMYVGDTRFARIYERVGYEVASMPVGTQFVEDAVTIKVRKRMAFLIRTVDRTGFKRVTSISAALTTLAS